MAEEYKGVTHTIVEMLARTKIQSVPRKKDTPRTELPEVGRPDDDRFGEVPTRQQEIQKKIIDEQDAQTAETQKALAPTKVKRPKKLEIEDIGKQPPTKVEISPELDNTPNVFASTEVKGKLVEDDEKERIKREVAKAQEMRKARKEAEHIAKFVSGIKSFGGFKVTGKLTAKDIEAGADIRRRLNKLKESRDDYTTVSIQYQTKGGNWITVRKIPNTSSNIMLAMRNVQKTYSSSRVRAIGAKGSVLDFQPIDPSSIATEETSAEDLKKAKGRTIEAWWSNKPKSLKNFKQVSQALKKKELDEGGSGVGAAAAKAVISGIAVKAALSAVQNNYPTAYGIAQKLKKGWDALPPTPGYTTFARQAPSGDMLSPQLTKDWIAKNKIKQTVENIVNEILTYKNSASLRARDAVAQRDAAIAQAQAQQAQAQQQQAQAQQPQQQSPDQGPPQKKKKGQTVTEGYAYNKWAKELKKIAKDRKAEQNADKDAKQAKIDAKILKKHEKRLRKVEEAKDTRHTGIEVEEPKFNQSIQRVAAHTKWNADAVHTYKHADGSKTRVDQELGTKIHKKIHSAPHRHRADIVQKMHRSAEGLKQSLNELSKKTYADYIPPASSSLGATSHEMATTRHDKGKWQSLVNKYLNRKRGIRRAATALRSK